MFFQAAVCGYLSHSSYSQLVSGEPVGPVFKDSEKWTASDSAIQLQGFVLRKAEAIALDPCLRTSIPESPSQGEGPDLGRNEPPSRSSVCSASTGLTTALFL